SLLSQSNPELLPIRTAPPLVSPSRSDQDGLGRTLTVLLKLLVLVRGAHPDVDCRFHSCPGSLFAVLLVLVFLGATPRAGLVSSWCQTPLNFRSVFGFWGK